ncbi:hypothetical protein [uncultured Methanobrevibacter sp.]|uniref:hypothetical protein n=1 Tax=uncultured Methanobrevibacter sp. TaxID=253161 RepID=UPI00262C82BE|nr:hypothetical protein [uncultured Methanobrevibacter sp.]
MTQHENKYVITNDLLKFLLYQLKEKNIAISHYRLQKMIFKIKKELGCDHPLYKQLPFYWAEEGPFSSVVAQIFSRLKKNNCYPFSTNSFFLNDESYMSFSSNKNIIEEFPEIEREIHKILSNTNSFFNKFDEDIFIDYAPYPIMHPFKYILFDIAKNEELLYSITPKNYLNVFYNCLSGMTNEKIDDEFLVLFSRLFSRLELIDNENKFRECWQCVRIPMELSWRTFARGISINFHDDFYNNIIPTWEQDHTENIKRLTKSIEFVEEKTGNIINSSSNRNSIPLNKRC